MKKSKILIGLLIALPLFSSLTLGCNAQILSLWYTPVEVGAGSNVEIHTSVKFTANMWETCGFMIENSVIPQDVPYVFLPLTVITDNCCPGNPNYDDDYFTIYCSGIGCEDTREMVLTIKAPTSVSKDACSTDPVRSQPGFYWRGDNYYQVTSSIWTDCGGSKYDGRMGMIHVKTDGGDRCPSGQTLCPDGYCRINCGSSCTAGWWNCPLIWVLKGSDVTIIVIAIIIIIAGVYLLKRGKKK